MSEFFTSMAIGATGLSAGLITWSLIRMNQALLHESQTQFGAQVHSDLGPLKVFMPTGRIGAMWIRSIFSRQQDFFKPIGRLIKQAGQPAGILPEELLGMSLANMILGSIFMFVFGQILNVGVNAQFVLFGIVVLMALLPFVWIYEMKKARHKSIRKGLPYALDLLTLGVEAGLDFTVAIEKISHQMPKTPLSQELNRMLANLQMGSSRREALNSLRDRIDLLDINLLTAALVQADDLGSPLGPILKIQAQRLREKRFQRAEEQAMKAPVKIVFPLALFILPVTGMIFLFPLGLKFKESIGIFQ